MSNAVKHAIVVCHPEPTSFTLAVAERYAQTVRRFGHEAIIRDLYRLGFNPALSASERRNRDKSASLAPDVAAELAALEGADVFVLVYPVWFGGAPAMIKGYIDRVFGARFMFDGPKGHRHPLFAGRWLVSLTTSGSMIAWLDEQGALTSLHNLFENYLRKVFGFGATKHLHLDGIVPELPPRDYKMFLKHVEESALQVMEDIAEARGEPAICPNSGRVEV